MKKIDKKDIIYKETNKVQELNNELINKMIKITNIIDSIEENDGTIIIKTAKNIIVENDGHSVFINKGVSVNISKEIHLNPDVSIDIDSISTIEQDLDKAKIKALEEAKKE